MTRLGFEILQVEMLDVVEVVLGERDAVDASVGYVGGLGVGMMLIETVAVWLLLLTSQLSLLLHKLVRKPKRAVLYRLRDPKAVG